MEKYLYYHLEKYLNRIMQHILKFAGVEKASDLPVVVRKLEPHKRVYLDELTAPVMLHKLVDTENDTGYEEKYDRIVVALKGHSNIRVTSLKKNPRVSGMTGTLALFITPNEDKRGIFGIATDDILHHVINWHHNNFGGHIGKSIDVCPNCQVVNDWYSVAWLKDLAEGKNPLFKISL